MFDTLKGSLQEKIEKNAVKLNLSWVKDGVVVNEEVILKRSRIPLIGDWGRIYPPVNEDGTWNIINAVFGGWKNLFKLLLVGAIVTVVFLAFKDIFSSYEALVNSPCVSSCINPII